MMVVVGWMGAWESDLSMEQEQIRERILDFCVTAYIHC